jgi:hypothetical protein
MTDAEKEEINQELTEWMGEKLDLWPDGSYRKFLDWDFFDNPSDWFRLWERAKGSEWLPFKNYLRSIWWENDSYQMTIEDFIMDIIIGPRFPYEWAKFLRDRKEGK